MDCSHWNDNWIASLYGELEPEEGRRVAEHLAVCAACRARLEAADETRRWLREAAPAVPPAPRIVMLRAARRGPAFWAFAGSIAASLLVFALGVGVGRRTAPAPLPTIEAPAAEPAVAALGARLERLERELADRPAADPETAVAGYLDRAKVVTQSDLDAGLERIAQRVETQRARDLEFLLGEISATEWRAGRWVNETREALMLVASRSDGPLREQ